MDLKQTILSGIYARNQIIIIEGNNGPKAINKEGVVPDKHIYAYEI